MTETNDSCAICCDTFNKATREPVKCPSCDFTACKTCVRKFLTTTTSGPKCMNCNMAWGQNFIIINLNRSWGEGDYRKHRKKLLLEQQLSLVPDTMNQAEQEKFRRDIYKENQKTQKQIEDLRLQITRLNNDIIANNYRAIGQAIPQRYILNGTNPHQTDANITTDDNASLNQRKKFICACPAENCRGFLSTAYKCGICEQFTCPDCLVVIGKEKNENHVCDENDKKTAEMIKKDTRPCPNCGERIYKIDGCDQMFCTACHTAFSWNTGEIEKGTVHNPHFNELQRRGGIVPIRNPGDAVCGGMPQITSSILFEIIFDHNAYRENTNKRAVHNKLSKEIRYTYRIMSEFNQYLLPERRRYVRNGNDYAEIRVKYILGDIKKEHMMEEVYKLDKIRQKNTEILNVSEVLGASAIDIFRSIEETTDWGMDVRQLINTNGEAIAFERYYAFVSNILNEQARNELRHNITKQIEERLDYLDRIVKYYNEQMKNVSISHNCTIDILHHKKDIDDAQYQKNLRHRYNFHRKGYSYMFESRKFSLMVEKEASKKITS